MQVHHCRVAVEHTTDYILPGTPYRLTGWLAGSTHQSSTGKGFAPVTTQSGSSNPLGSTMKARHNPTED